MNALRFKEKGTQLVSTYRLAWGAWVIHTFFFVMMWMGQAPTAPLHQGMAIAFDSQSALESEGEHDRQQGSLFFGEKEVEVPEEREASEGFGPCLTEPKRSDTSWFFSRASLDRQDIYQKRSAFSFSADFYPASRWLTTDLPSRGPPSLLGLV